jgi:hypothetical protein
VTLLEEMPVQETIDAATELTRAGIRLGAVVVNRARPALVGKGQVGKGGRVDLAGLGRGLAAAGIDAALAGPLGGQLAEYADRQATEAANLARLDAVDAPRIELPDLTPPVELGELTELAAYFLAGQP